MHRHCKTLVAYSRLRIIANAFNFLHSAPSPLLLFSLLLSLMNCVLGMTWFFQTIYLKATLFATVVLFFPQTYRNKNQEKKVHPQQFLLVGAAVFGKKFKHAAEESICLKNFHFPVGATSAPAQKEYVVK